MFGWLVCLALLYLFIWKHAGECPKVRDSSSLSQMWKMFIYWVPNTRDGSWDAHGIYRICCGVLTGFLWSEGLLMPVRPWELERRGHVGQSSSLSSLGGRATHLCHVADGSCISNPSTHVALPRAEIPCCYGPRYINASWIFVSGVSIQEECLFSCQCRVRLCPLILLAPCHSVDLHVTLSVCGPAASRGIHRLLPPSM